MAERPGDSLARGASVITLAVKVSGDFFESPSSASVM